MLSLRMAPQVTDGPRRSLPSPRSTTMLYLLVSALIIGAAESQTANTTEEVFRDVEGTQTFNNSDIKPENVTSSWDKYKLSHVEEELQNQTVITEDDESFQEQEEEFPGRRCLEELLTEYSHSLCRAEFDKEMLTISPEDWCVLENIIRPYNELTVCLETLSSWVNCYYPNSNVQDFFRQIHSYYFHNCSTEEQPFADAPHGLVVVLTLIPVSLIPVLVYVVVWKSKVQD